MKKNNYIYNLKYKFDGNETIEELAKKIISDLEKIVNNTIPEEEPQYPVKKLTEITSITFYNSINIDGDDNIKALVIEVENEPYIILDINYGLSISPLDIITNEIKNNKNKKAKLYKIDNDFQSDINFGEVKEVSLYRKAILTSKLNEEIVCSSDLIEFKDCNNKSFFVDYINNDIYKREDLYKIIKYNKKIKIFKRHEENDVNIKIFNTILNKVKNWSSKL